MPAAPPVIEVTRHAAERYGERVRAAVEQQTKRAREEIRQLVQTGTLQREPPAWMRVDAEQYAEDTQYVMLGPDVALVVRPSLGRNGAITVVITVMTPWDQGARHVTDRRRRRAERFAQKHPPRAPDRPERSRAVDEEFRFDAGDWPVAG